MYARWNVFARELADQKEIQDPLTKYNRTVSKEEGDCRNGEAWHVWTDWIDDRIKGKAGIEALEVERVLIPEGDWDKGPHHVNHLIAAMQRRQFAERKMLPEGVERNPETGRYRTLPDAPTKPDAY